MKKIIKKISLYSVALCASVLLVSTVSNAQELSAQTSAGSTVQIDDAGAGPGFSYNPSPSIFLVVASTTNAYAIQAMHQGIANGDRNEYGIWSGNTGYYMQVNPDSAGTTVVLADFTIDLATGTDLTATPYGAWTNMGGGGS